MVVRAKRWSWWCVRDLQRMRIASPMGSLQPQALPIYAFPLSPQSRAPNNGCYADCNKRSCLPCLPKSTCTTQTIATSVALAHLQPVDLRSQVFLLVSSATQEIRMEMFIHGGSSVLGLVVFLTVGMMFGNDHMD
jgi:hypothetical protein